MRKYWIINGVFLVLLLSACKDKQKEGYLTSIAEMQHALDSLELVAEENRIDTLSLLIQHIKGKTKEFGNLYYPDTVDLKIAGMMNSYKEARKAMSSNSGNLAKVRQSIPEVRQKLEDLQHDIEHGVGARDQYQEHIQFELGKVNQIKTILSFYMENKVKYDSVFHVNDQRIQALIVELKNEE